MEKIRFACDYSEGAAPEILSRLMETNLEQTPGYGEDVYCEAARAKIRALCAKEDAEVQFAGGTQTNMTGDRRFVPAATSGCVSGGYRAYQCP